MDLDDLYRQATGQAPPQAPPQAQAGPPGVMTDDEMLGELASRGARPEHIDVFPMRLEPNGEHPGDKVFRIPVPLQDGSFLAVAFSFGQPSDDEMENWKPRWRAVDGPMNREELEELGRA
jgi:hypothetical protein